MQDQLLRNALFQRLGTTVPVFREIEWHPDGKLNCCGHCLVRTEVDAAIGTGPGKLIEAGNFANGDGIFLEKIAARRDFRGGTLKQNDSLRLEVLRGLAPQTFIAKILVVVQERRGHGDLLAAEDQYSASIPFLPILRLFRRLLTSADACRIDFRRGRSPVLGHSRRVDRHVVKRQTQACVENRRNSDQLEKLLSKHLRLVH